MPHRPLAQCLLTFMDDPAIECDTHPYDMLPWTNKAFCHLVGIEKLDKENQQITIRPDRLNAMKRSGKAALSEANQKAIYRFLCEFRNRVFEEGGTKVVFESLSDMTNVKLYDDMVKGMLGIPGGPMDITWEAMELTGCTPARAMRDVWLANERARNGRKVQESDLKVPGGGTTLPLCYVPAARGIFGEEAVGMDGVDVVPHFKPALVCVAAKVYQNAQRRVKYNLDKRDTLQGLYERALEAAEAKTTAAKLNKATGALYDWRQTAEVTGEAVTVNFEAQQAKLAELWKNVGFRRKENGEVERVKPTRVRMSTEKEMEEAFRLYLNLHFPSDDREQEACRELLANMQSESQDGVSDSQVAAWSNQFSGDHGVEHIKDKSKDELLLLLGIKPENGQYPFGEPGATATNPSTEKQRILPRWHQLGGTLVILQRMFTSAIGDHPTPSLLCDDVGLGKTIQVIGTISMLVHIIELQSKGFELPPLFSGTPYFAGRKTMTKKPFLILVPGSLTNQWRTEIGKFTMHGAFRVIVYNSRRRSQFFQPGQEWDTAVSKAESPHRTIVLAEMAAVGNESAHKLQNHSYDKDFINSGTPEELGVRNANSIFDKEFTMMATDEVHMLRNVGHQYRGAIRLAANSDVCIAATATPVFTGAKDLVSACRIVRLVGTLGAQGRKLGHDMDSLARVALREWKQMNPPDKDPSKSHDADGRASDSQTDMSQSHKSAYIARGPVQLLMPVVQPILIRRTGESKEPNGDSVLSLKPLVSSVAWVKLPPWEVEALEKMSNGCDCSDRNGLANFFLEWKLNSFLPGLLDSVDRALNWTLETYQQEASAKIKMIVGIVTHHQDVNARPMMWSRDTQQRDLEAEAALDWTPATRKRKFLIMSPYEVCRSVLKAVFALHGWKSEEYDGRMTQNARTKAIDSFENDENVDIMLISNVGTTGLNITRASIVIFVNGMWSGPEEAQTSGRARRHGQIEDVASYRVTAVKSPDEILLSHSMGKGVILNQVIGESELGKKLFGPQKHDEDEDKDEEEDEDEESPKLPRTRRAAVPRATKAKQGTTTITPANNGSSNGDAKRHSQLGANQKDKSKPAQSEAKGNRKGGAKPKKNIQATGSAESTLAMESLPASKKPRGRTDKGKKSRPKTQSTVVARISPPPIFIPSSPLTPPPFHLGPMIDLNDDSEQHQSNEHPVIDVGTIDVGEVLPIKASGVSPAEQLNNSQRMTEKSKEKGPSVDSNRFRDALTFEDMIHSDAYEDTEVTQDQTPSQGLITSTPAEAAPVANSTSQPHLDVDPNGDLSGPHRSGFKKSAPAPPPFQKRDHILDSEGGTSRGMLGRVEESKADVVSGQDPKSKSVLTARKLPREVIAENKAKLADQRHESLQSGAVRPQPPPARKRPAQSTIDEDISTSGGQSETDFQKLQGVFKRSKRLTRTWN